MKIYQVIMQDEYNNLFLLGFYKDLKDSIKDINDWLEVYNVSIDELGEYPGTFEPSFDREIEVEEEGCCVYVRGFILNEGALKEYEII